MPILNKIEVPRLIFYMSSKNMINILQDGPLLLATGFTGGRTPISGLLTLLLAAIGPILLKIYPNPRISVVLWNMLKTISYVYPDLWWDFIPFLRHVFQTAWLNQQQKSLGSFKASSRSEGLTSNSGSRRGWLFGGQTSTVTDKPFKRGT